MIQRQYLPRSMFEATIGAIEQLSEGLIEPALRRLNEVLADEQLLEAVLGRLDDFISRSGHLISPFVFWSPGSNALVANPSEVDAAFRVSLTELNHPDALRWEPLLHFVMPSLPSTLHAPTAAIVYQFREVALHGREVRVAGVEQPFFAWR